MLYSERLLTLAGTKLSVLESFYCVVEVLNVEIMIIKLCYKKTKNTFNSGLKFTSFEILVNPIVN